MDPRQNILNDSRQLDEADQRSYDESLLGVAIFKHSTTCGISDLVISRLAGQWKFSPDVLPLYYVDVRGSRPVSNAIAEKYGITHESPQLLIIKKGKCIYDASHNGIVSADVERFFEEAGLPGTH